MMIKTNLKTRKIFNKTFLPLADVSCIAWNPNEIPQDVIVQIISSA